MKVVTLNFCRCPRHKLFSLPTVLAAFRKAFSKVDLKELFIENVDTRGVEGKDAGVRVEALVNDSCKISIMIWRDYEYASVRCINCSDKVVECVRAFIDELSRG